MLTVVFVDVISKKFIFSTSEYVANTATTDIIVMAFLLSDKKYNLN